MGGRNYQKKLQAVRDVVRARTLLVQAFEIVRQIEVDRFINTSFPTSKDAQRASRTMSIRQDYRNDLVDDVNDMFREIDTSLMLPIRQRKARARERKRLTRLEAKHNAQLASFCSIFEFHWHADDSQIIHPECYRYLTADPRVLVWKPPYPLNVDVSSNIKYTRITINARNRIFRTDQHCAVCDFPFITTIRRNRTKAPITCVRVCVHASIPKEDAAPFLKSLAHDFVVDLATTCLASSNKLTDVTNMTVPSTTNIAYVGTEFVNALADACLASTNKDYMTEIWEFLPTLVPEDDVRVNILKYVVYEYLADVPNFIHGTHAVNQQPASSSSTAP